jgi:molybdate transport system substrate-binding protein
VTQGTFGTATGRSRGRAARAALLLTLALLTAAGVAASSPRASQASSSSISVLYAGSLVDLMQQQLGPAFDGASGTTVEGLPAGSSTLGNDIKGGLQRADVFISAAPSVNDTLMGSANGNWVSWYGEFAAAPLVIAYNPKSTFAADFKKMPWYRVLELPGIRIGRTDPRLDPKGELTIQFMRAAGKEAHQAGLEQKVLGSDENTAQIFPEETLLGRLEAGQLDVGFFYSVEAVAAKLPYIAPKLGKHYGARYTVTIPRDGANPFGALDFVDYLLGPAGTKIMTRDGFTLLKGEVGGDPGAAPASVKALLAPQT